MQKILTLLLLLFAGVCIGMMLTRSCNHPEPPLPEMEIVRDTVIDVHIDTQYFPKPVPYKVIQRDTVYISCNNKSNDTSNDVYVYETKQYKDSLLTAQISGINATLDWYETYIPVRKEYIYTDVYIPPGRWSVGVQAGVGVTPKGLQPYIGVGLTYRLDF